MTDPYAALAARTDRRTVADLRAGGSLKWTLFEDRIGAFVAESDLGTAPVVLDALREAVDAQRFGYLPPALSDRMSVAYAGWAADRYGWTVDPARVRPVADVMAAFRATVRHFSAPGSTIVLPTPAYMPFLTVPGTLGRRLVQVPLVPDGDRLVHDLDAIDHALRSDPRGGGLLVLCNPHNPTGTVVEREELEALAEIVDRHGGRVFADEIHAPLRFDRRPFVPYASVSPATAAHTVTGTSASKAWNIPGLKTAQLVLSNDVDQEQYRRFGFSVQHGASTLGVIASTAAYSEGRPWLDGVLSYLSDSRGRLADLVVEHLPGAVFREPEATYIGWIDVSALAIDGPPGAFFREQAGVVLTEGALLGRGYDGFVRLVFATPRPILAEALAAMGDAVRRG
jgi:cysteine-S-conjugate beta-lyase